MLLDYCQSLARALAVALNSVRVIKIEGRVGWNLQGGALLLKPGDPARSLVLLRMQALDDKRMPPLASHLVDDAGVALLSAWISALTDCH